MPTKPTLNNLRISTKLLLLNLMICAAFILIVCVSVVSFHNVGKMSTDVAKRDIRRVIGNSRTARELSKVFGEINLLSRTFYRRDDYLDSEGSRLVSIVHNIAENTADPDLNKSLLALSNDLESYLSQCAAVNAVLYARESIDLKTHAELTRLEDLIGDLLVNSTLKGEDTSFVEQLLTLVIGYRESLLEIGKLYAEGVPTHYSISLEGNMSPVIADIDDLILRLQTLSASIPEVAEYGEKLVTNVQAYKETVLRSYEVKQELDSRMTNLTHSKDHSMSELERTDQMISKTTQLLSDKIRKIILSSEAAVLMLSLFVIVLLGFVTASLIRSNINKPMKAILEGISSFRKGNFETQIELSRQDEWDTIEKALNNMAADLLKSYEALRNSEERFRELAELLPQPVFELDLEGNLTYSNRCGFEIFGYNQDDLEKGVNASQLYILEERERVKQNIRKVSAGEEFEDHEYTGLKKDGGTFPMLVYSAPIIRADKAVGVRGIVLDITERKRAEQTLREAHDELERRVEDRTAELSKANVQLTNEVEDRKQAENALRESQEKYRAMVEAFDGLIYVCSQDYRIEFINERFIERTGHDPVGKLCYSVVHDLDSVCSWCVNEQVFRGETVRSEVQSPKDNGWYYVVNSPIYHPDGSISKQAMIQDITERKLAAEALEESYNIINRSPAAAFVRKNAEAWPVEFVSENVQEIFGYAVEDFTSGKVTYAEIVHPDDLDRVAAEVHRYSKELERKEFTHEPYRVVTKAGEVKWLDDRIHIRRDEEGRITHYQGIVLDITERHRLEEQLQRAHKMEAVGTLAGGVAHEFNNLLQTVQGYADLLMLDMEEEDPGYRELQEIVKGAQRGGDLTRRLLTFSRKVESNLRPVNLNLVVDKTRRLLERTVPKMIEIESHLAPDIKIANADPTQIEQVLVNLVVNAKDAMPDGGKLIIQTENVTLDEEYCRKHPEAEEGEHVLLSVTDTGCGIDKATMEHIFDPFYTTKGLANRDGLSLAMAYGVVKNHSGLIECSSELGLGTTFKIYLPAIEHYVKPDKEAEVAVCQGGTETILLVDDEECIRSLGENLLNRYGYTVHTAPDGESALELYRKEQKRIHLIVLDLIMPGMGGRRCLEELININPEVKVIVISGYSDAGSMKESIEARAKRFIGKPYKDVEMLQIVREVLDVG